jgi:hypothetical protein
MTFKVTASDSMRLFIERFASEFVDERQRRRAVRLAELLDTVARRLSREVSVRVRARVECRTQVHALEPRALIHGDFKLSNMFVGSPSELPHDSRRIYIIDWQVRGTNCERL